MIRFFRLLMVVLLLCVVALLAAVTTMHFAIHGAEVAIPDFRGLTISEATRKAASLDLNLTVDNRFYSAEMPSGRVLTQSPASGTIVRKEWHVRVTQSLGPQRIAIPNVLGQPERTATISIRRAGLDLGNVAHMPYLNTTGGTVIAQNPAPDAEGVERPSLSLLVADPSPQAPLAFVMPDFTGQLFATAASIVAHAGLKVGPPLEAQQIIAPVMPVNGTPMPALPAAPGTIVGQNPQPGSRIDANTPIQFTVAH
ncbi:MAG TPA: PASTA domain-containing protein [Alloacidobacterium sp.]|nr:PASTA domain-containing protein [Alloacidobacterium sp.]